MPLTEAEPHGHLNSFSVSDPFPAEPLLLRVVVLLLRARCDLQVHRVSPLVFHVQNSKVIRVLKSKGCLTELCTTSRDGERGCCPERCAPWPGGARAAGPGPRDALRDAAAARGAASPTCSGSVATPRMRSLQDGQTPGDEFRTALHEM